MQFLRTLFWVVLAVVAMVFAMRNWVPVTVALWGGLLVEAKLPVLIYGAFLLGLLPTYAWHRAARWRLRRRIESQERALFEIRDVTTPPAATVASDPAQPAPAPATLEPPAQS
jgi:lipopolysaccharide assembly protein A